MSVTFRVFLDPTRMPLPSAWAREIRAQGFALDLDTDFDPRTFSGFLPCVHQGQPTGFEYSFDPEPALEEDARRAAGNRSLEISFATHSDMRELVSSMISSAVLASMTDGVVWSDESSEAFSAPDAIEIARETEGEL